MDILNAQVKAKNEGMGYAVLTVAEEEGPSPFKIGKRMLLLENGQTLGTIGGGAVERIALEDAGDAIKKGKSVFKRYVNDKMNEEAGLGCSFSCSILIEVVKPELQLVVCGAGHVGSAVLKLAKFLNFRTVLVDARPKEHIGEILDMADRYIHSESFEKGILDGNIQDGAYYVCCAPTHTQDKSALRGALQKSFAYIGMLGSIRKTKEMYGQLENEGMDRDLLEKVHCPVGLDICNMSPEEVAFSILSEILMLKNEGTGKMRVEIARERRGG